MIRQYQDTDINAVVSVWRTASDFAHPFLSKSFQHKQSANFRNIYPQYAKIWVKELNGEIIGFIAMIDAEVGAIFVHPKYHGQGLGYELMNFAVKQKGAVTLDVFKQNAVGRKFYDRYGFKTVGEYLHESSGQMTLKLEYNPA